MIVEMEDVVVFGVEVGAPETLVAARLNFQAASPSRLPRRADFSPLHHLTFTTQGLESTIHLKCLHLQLICSHGKNLEIL